METSPQLRKTRLSLLLFALGLGFLYLPYLANYFFAEDWVVLEGYRESRLSDPLSILKVTWKHPHEGLFLEDLRTPLSQLNYFRPLVPFVFYGEYLLFGSHPWGYHLVSFLMLIGIVLLSALLLSDLKISSTASGLVLTALSFHPLLSRLVMRFTSQDILLSMMASLFLVRISLKSLQEEKKILWWVSLAIWMLTLLHEGNIFLFPLLAFASFLYGSTRWGGRLLGQFFIFLFLFVHFVGFPLPTEHCPPLLLNWHSLSTLYGAASAWTTLAPHTIFLFPLMLHWLPPLRLLVVSPQLPALLSSFLLLLLWIYLFLKREKTIRQAALFFLLFHLLWFLPAFPFAMTDSRWAPAGLWLFLSFTILFLGGRETEKLLWKKIVLCFLILLAFLASSSQNLAFRRSYARKAMRFALSLRQLSNSRTFDRIFLVGLPEELSLGIADFVRFQERRTRVKVFTLSLRAHNQSYDSLRVSPKKIVLREKREESLSYESVLQCGRRYTLIPHHAFTTFFRFFDRDSKQERTVIFKLPLQQGKDLLLLVRPNGEAVSLPFSVNR